MALLFLMLGTSGIVRARDVTKFGAILRQALMENPEQLGQKRREWQEFRIKLAQQQKARNGQKDLPYKLAKDR